MRIRLVLLSPLLLLTTITGCPDRTTNEAGGAAASASNAPSAAPGAPREEVVSCIKQDKGKSLAEKQYPGRTRAQLTRVVVLNCHTGGAPGCHPVSQTSLGIRDGVVTAWCEPDEVPSLTFVTPF